MSDRYGDKKVNALVGFSLGKLCRRFGFGAERRQDSRLHQVAPDDSGILFGQHGRDTQALSQQLHGRMWKRRYPGVENKSALTLLASAEILGSSHVPCELFGSFRHIGTDNLH